MRKNKVAGQANDIRILILDDDEIITVTLQAYFQSSGYEVDIENDPAAAIERIKHKHYDILLLDFLMSPICGDEVVARIRKFDADLYIVLLTGHKSLAPPIRTIRELDIQGYYEKSDRFDQLELLVESCVKSIRHMRAVRAYQKSLTRLVEAMPQIYCAQSVNHLLEIALSQLEPLFGCKDAYIAVYSPAKQRAYLGSGCFAGAQEAAFARLDALCAKTGQTTLREGDCLCAPLTDSRGGTIGLLCAKISPEGEQLDLERLFALCAGQTSAAISNVLLHALLEDKNRELGAAYAQLNNSYAQTISALRLMVDARDIYTRGHSDRVSYFAERIARAMGRDDAYCARIRVAGLFHDVGKVGTPDAILLKGSRLTDEEYEKIRQHPARGAEILSAIAQFQDIAPVVRQHHERFDGQGYPDGLPGGRVLEQARIICVADAFDAMTSNRRYRPSLSLAQAVAQLQEGSGTQFDPAVVDVFLRLLETQWEKMQGDLAATYREQLGCDDE